MHFKMLAVRDMDCRAKIESYQCSPASAGVVSTSSLQHSSRYKKSKANGSAMPMGHIVGTHRQRSRCIKIVVRWMLRVLKHSTVRTASTTPPAPIGQGKI